MWPHSPLVVLEGQDGVVGEDEVEDEAEVEEVAVDVLQDQREAGLAACSAGAARRPRRPAVTARRPGSRPGGSSSRSAGTRAGRSGSGWPGRWPTTARRCRRRAPRTSAQHWWRGRASRTARCRACSSSCRSGRRPRWRRRRRPAAPPAVMPGATHQRSWRRVRSGMAARARVSGWAGAGRGDWSGHWFPSDLIRLSSCTVGPASLQVKDRFPLADDSHVGSS